MRRLALASALSALAVLPAHADPASVEAVTLRPEGGSAWHVAVTIRHGDTGWDDYADGWRVETAEGVVLGTRTLLHPHVEEQPFTRALGGVAVPDGVDALHVRTRTSVTGWSDNAAGPFPLPPRD